MNWSVFFGGFCSGAVVGTLIVAVSAAVDGRMRTKKLEAEWALERAIDKRIGYHTTMCKVVGWDSFSEFSQNVRDRLDKVDPPKRRKGDKK